MTFGAGGHSKAFLDSLPDCQILALDRDPQAHKVAQSLAEERLVVILHSLVSP